MKGLDLRGFKKIASDKHTTTLQHPEGHQIKVVHSALKPEMKKALTRLPLADGGQIPGGNGSPDMDKKGAAEISKGAQESGWQPKQWADNLKHAFDGDAKKDSKGGMVKMFNGGGVGDAVAAAKDASPNAPVVINVGQPAPQSTPAPIPMPEPSPQSTQMQGPETFGPVVTPAIASEASPGTPPPAAPGQAPIDQSQASPAAPQAPGLDANIQKQQPTPPSTGQPDPYGLNGQRDLYSLGANSAIAGIQGQAKASAALGQEQAKALQDSQQKLQTLGDNYTKNIADLDAHRKELAQGVADQKIDPNRYWSNLGTGQKIGNAIGLILGGIGSGILHQDNPVLKMIQSAIDRDVDSQKMELGKKENLLNSAMKQYGNLHDAAMATKAYQLDLVGQKLQEAAAKAQGPMAKAAAQQAMSQVYNMAAEHSHQVAMNQTLMQSGLAGGAKDDGSIAQTIQSLRVANPNMAKNLEERYVPGIGISSIPVPNEARNNLLTKQTFQDAAQRFYDWAQKNGGTLGDRATVNEGKTMAAELQSLYRNAINGGVFKKGEQEFIDNIIDSDPTKFFNDIRVLPKLKSVIDSNDAQLNVAKKAYGLPAAKPLTLGAPVRK